MDVEIIQDLGSGLNYSKRGLKRLINLITDNRVERLVLTHKDRFVLAAGITKTRFISPISAYIVLDLVKAPCPCTRADFKEYKRG